MLAFVHRQHSLTFASGNRETTLYYEMHLSRFFPSSEKRTEILYIPGNVLQRKFLTLSIFTSYLFRGKLGRKISFRELMENGSREILKTFPFLLLRVFHAERNVKLRSTQKYKKVLRNAAGKAQRTSSLLPHNNCASLLQEYRIAISDFQGNREHRLLSTHR